MHRCAHESMGINMSCVVGHVYTCMSYVYHMCTCVCVHVHVHMGVHMLKPLNPHSLSCPWNDSVPDSLMSVTTDNLPEHMLLPSQVETGTDKGVSY